ncbi:3-oxoacyl-ACP synthase III family protein [Micromonospora sp. NPDC047557]|uniref:3-oxoacyl-ACP synthase III family protein n=1 Tax=Micromonospora sp. NPDC047557 TaxID=3364250 RepID=UPI0037181D3D
MPIGVTGLGSHVPETIIDNATVGRWAGVDPAWVTERTGITERRYADAGTATSDLAAAAAREALAGDQRRIEGLIVATCTPDVPQPSTAAILQHKLGLSGVPAFDVNAVCSGFLFGLTVAEGMMLSRFGRGEMLVVGADMFSRIMDRGDRKTVSLFGDGAGAVVLGQVPEGYGIVASRLQTHGEHHEYVVVEAGGTRQALTEETRAAGRHYFRMDGRSVRDYAVQTQRKLIEQVLADAALTLADVDRFVFHQANTRLLESLAREMGIGMDRVALTAPEYGNTAGASIPVTLHASHRDRPLQRGERILMSSVGGGMTAAALLLTWY